MNSAIAAWPQEDGQPVACRDKIAILDENFEELSHVLQDAFEDAILMGVAETFMRQTLAGLVGALKTPGR